MRAHRLFNRRFVRLACWLSLLIVLGLAACRPVGEQAVGVTPGITPEKTASPPSASPTPAASPTLSPTTAAADAWQNYMSKQEGRAESSPLPSALAQQP